MKPGARTMRSRFASRPAPLALLLRPSPAPTRSTMRSPSCSPTSSRRPNRRSPASPPPRRRMAPKSWTRSRDGRLFVDADNKRVVYKDATGGDVFDARTGAKVDGVEGLQESARQQRRAPRVGRGDGARSASAPPIRSAAFAAARDCSTIPTRARSPIVDAQLAKETDAGAKAALEQARAAHRRRHVRREQRRRACAPSTRSRRAAIRRRRTTFTSLAAKHDDPAIRKAADAAISRINTSLFLWGMAQNGWYGLSAASVLLLAAIGLAITFGVMGVINMAHGEMVMLGAYATYVVQMLLPPSMANWSMPLALPVAFVVAGLAGVVIERLRRALPLHPPARHAAGHLGRFADPATGGADDLRREQPAGLFAAVPFRLVLRRRPRDHLQPALDHRARGGRVRGAAVRAARHLVRPANARGDAEPPHGFGDGHFDGARRHAGLRARLGRRRNRRRRADPDRQCLAQSRPGLHHRQLHGRRVRRRRQSLGRRRSAPSALGLANKILEPTIGAVQGQIALLVFIILFIQKRPRGLFAQKGRAVEA